MPKQPISINEIVDNYTTILYKRALYLINHKEDAEDIVQDVIVAAFKSIDQFKENSNLRTWLFGILNHKVADYYRNKYKNSNPISLDRYFNNDGSWKDEHFFKDWNVTDDSLFEDPTFKNIFDNCIEKLPPKWNIPFKLYYLENKNTDFLCQELGLSTTNIWKILQRSRLQLKDCLEINWFNKY